MATIEQAGQEANEGGRRMRLVQWTDDEGYHRQALIRSTDPDDVAHIRIPLEPPKLDGIPSIPLEVKLDLHNELMARNLITWADVQAQQSGVTGTVDAVARRNNLSKQEARNLRRTVLAAYRR